MRTLSRTAVPVFAIVALAAFHALGQITLQKADIQKVFVQHATIRFFSDTATTLNVAVSPHFLVCDAGWLIMSGSSTTSVAT